MPPLYTEGPDRPSRYAHIARLLYFCSVCLAARGVGLECEFATRSRSFLMDTAVDIFSNEMQRTKRREPREVMLVYCAHRTSILRSKIDARLGGRLALIFFAVAARREPKMDRLRLALLIVALVVDFGRRLPRRCGSAVPQSCTISHRRIAEAH
jgi:hypothetical protein